MTVDEALVERIVSGVLQQMGTPPQTVRAAPPEPSDRESNGRTGPAAGDDSELVLNENVVTGDLLEQRLNGQRRIRVAPQSVLTPSARDVLREHGIECCEGNTAETMNQPGIASRRWLTVVLTSTPAVDTVIPDVARSAGIACDRELVGSVSDAVSRAVGELCRRAVAGVVTFAESAEAVACLANRNRAVRAAVVTDLDSVERVRQSMGANLFVVNPRETSYFELRNLLRGILSGGRPEMPTSWQE